MTEKGRLKSTLLQTQNTSLRVANGDVAVSNSKYERYCFTSVRNDEKKSRVKAFTLAEVLITLVVIGIIAAITVPVMMANHRKTETQAKLKKVYSTYVNAIKLAEVEEGVPSPDWDHSLGCGQFFNKYLKKQFRYTDIPSGSPLRNYGYTGTASGYLASPCPIMVLDDGTYMFFDQNTPVVDINGSKKPNKDGRDVFYFPRMHSRADMISNNLKNPIGYEVFSTKYTREEALAACGSNTHNKIDGCSQLLYMDGWEIKDDYPEKI